MKGKKTAHRSPVSEKNITGSAFLLKGSYKDTVTY